MLVVGWFYCYSIAVVRVAWLGFICVCWWVCVVCVGLLCLASLVVTLRLLRVVG